MAKNCPTVTEVILQINSYFFSTVSKIKETVYLVYILSLTIVKSIASPIHSLYTKIQYVETEEM